MAWTIGFGVGLSASSTSSTRAAVAAGIPLQASGGESLAPSWVKRAGSAAPSGKAGLVTRRATGAPSNSAW